MGRRTVTQLANQIKRVLSPTLINDLGREVGFCVRERLITPYRLVVSLLAGHTMGQVETLADIQRQFNALFDTTVAYKPFHNQLAKRTFPDLMREVLCRILQHWVVEVLQPKADGAAGRVRTHSHPGRMLVCGQGDASRAVSGTIQQAEPRGGGAARDDELARRIGRAGHAHGGYGIGSARICLHPRSCVGTCFWPTVATSRRSIWPTSPERAATSWCVRVRRSIRWCEQRMTVEERSSWSCAGVG